MNMNQRGSTCLTAASPVLQVSLTYRSQINRLVVCSAAAPPRDIRLIATDVDGTLLVMLDTRMC